MEKNNYCSIQIKKLKVKCTIITIYNISYMIHNYTSLNIIILYNSVLYQEEGETEGKEKEMFYIKNQVSIINDA